MREPDLDALAARARTVDDVVDLSGGTAGEVATYLPGRRIAGIRDHDGRIEVHLAVGGARPVHQTAAAVRAALAPLVAGRPVDIVVAEVQLSDRSQAPVDPTAEPTSSPV